VTRKRMFTVALIGPDGAGKTTIARQLESALPMRAKYLYMGVNWDASNHLLPTTRLIHALRRRRGSQPAAGGPPPDPAETQPPAGRAVRRPLRAAWSTLSLLNRFGEEWYRQGLAWAYMRGGTVVIFDRHFFSDYYAHDIAVGVSRSLGRHVHGFLLAHVYPKPDLVVFLDAPPELLLARKGEGTVESLQRRRQDYLELAPLTKHFVVVDASRPLDEVTREVAAAIEGFSAARSPGSRAEASAGTKGRL
jgi:thymidylate kinase